ncbi:Cdc6-related protein, AAA superfamily ATPase [Sphingobium faniae]|nr:Cdc6-related protein, AAA superfamily ATPase [Sphingobium faniae]
MTAIDHDFVQPPRSEGGTLDWLRTLPRKLAGVDKSDERTIPASPPIDATPLLLEELAPPSFSRSAGSDPETDGARPLSMGAMAQPLKPISLRRDSIYAAFNTAMPVTDRHGLTGRNAELEKLVESIVVQRKHAVIFGTRGSGKTSLARVFGDLADEAGCVALYGSANGETDFETLFRPFLAELPMSAAGKEKARALLSGSFDVPRLASLLVEDVRQRSILIIDEYDRVHSEAPRQDVAALMKLLTDLHSPVQLVLVGIASDIDGLIAAHPSLRRHIAPQRVNPIPTPELARLLLSCSDRASLSIDLEALDMLANAAMGSPYHARLFGMQAALIPEAAGRTRITPADVEAGLIAALEGWTDMSAITHGHLARALRDAPHNRRMIALAAVVASQSYAISQDLLVQAGAELFGPSDRLHGEAADALARLAPALAPTSGGQSWMFEDTLAPQFLLLMAKQPAPSTIAPNRTEEMRAMLKGVDGL